MFPSHDPREWDITDKIPAADRQGLVAVQFRAISNYRNQNDDTNIVNRVYMQGGDVPFRMVTQWGCAQAGDDLRWHAGNTNTFYAPVNKTTVNGTVRLLIQTYATGSNDTNHTLTVDGYIATEYNA